MMPEKPKVGDIVEYDGKPYEVVSVWAKLTPGDPNGKPKSVKIIGWGTGLKRVI